MSVNIFQITRIVSLYEIKWFSEHMKILNLLQIRDAYTIIMLSVKNSDSDVISLLLVEK